MHRIIVVIFMENAVYIILAVTIIYTLKFRTWGQGPLFIFKRGFNSNFKKNDAQILRNLLCDNFVVYNMLEAKGRRRFENRVCRFIKMKDFRTGGKSMEITDQMRVMVASAAIQITYGYPEVYFKHFQTIILYPYEYYSTITGQYHAGEVNAGGAIVLSWRNLMAGFSNLSDGRNLALHEMAHALQLTNIVENTEYDFIDWDTMRAFEKFAHTEIRKIENNEHTFFRSYGAANQQEFFSVAVECFFEQPLEFQNYNAQLYMLLARILKIDLLNFVKH